MSTTIVIDTWAWVAYFDGKPEGRKLNHYLDGDYHLIVPSIVIAELSNVFRRKELGRMWETQQKPFIELNAMIYPLEQEIADLAGKIKTERRKKWKDFGLAEGIVAATAEAVQGKIITGDKHLLDGAIDIS